MKTKRFLKWGALSIVVIIVTALLYLWHSYNEFINLAPDNKNEQKVILIKYKESIPNIINTLKENGIITSSPKFYYFAKLNNALGKIKYGEYEFSTSMKPFDVLDKLIKGKVKEYKITIPEGYNLYQIATVISDNQLANKDSFLKTALNNNFIASLGLAVQSLEGYCFPDTYYFNKNMSIEDMITKMYSNFRSKFTDEMRERAAELKMAENEIVTLASIIEKETSYQDEMPTVSAVFYNRLRKNMRLESDPTVIYGITNFDGDLRVADLRTPSPYNTYLIHGLPPSPIANPGIAAIKAALYPSEVLFLYFVSKNNGTHYFSKTFQEHKKAVYKYQIKHEKAQD